MLMQCMSVDLGIHHFSKKISLLNINFGYSFEPLTGTHKLCFELKIR